MSEKDTRSNTAVEPENDATVQVNAPENKAKKKTRRRKRIGVPVTLTLVLLIIALLFGLVLGYGYGRNRSRDTIADLRAQVTQLSDQLVVASGEEVDIFTDTLSPEAEAALAELAGEAAPAPEASAAAALSSDVFGEIDESEADADPVTVAEYKGGKITADDARAEYTRRMSDYLFAGYSKAADGSALMQEVLSDLVQDAILYGRAEKMRLTDVSEQDAQAVHAQAIREFDDRIAAATAFTVTEDAEEDPRAAAEKYLLENEGVTIESIEAELTANLWRQKLRDDIVKDITVADADVQAMYEETVAAQEQQFEDSADSYEFAQMSGELIAYNLPGYRRIQVIRLNVNNEDNVSDIYDLNDQLVDLDPTADAEEIARIRAELDALYATTDGRAKSVADKLAGGADFDEMIDQYGEDIGMKDSDIRARGYVIAADSPLWAAEVRSAAMALAKIGDVSDPVRSGDSVCILKYIGDVESGAVPMEEIRNTLAEQALDAAKEQAYTAQVSAWIEEAAPAYYPERMQ